MEENASVVQTFASQRRSWRTQCASHVQNAAEHKHADNADRRPLIGATEPRRLSSRTRHQQSCGSTQAPCSAGRVARVPRQNENRGRWAARHGLLLGEQVHPQPLRNVLNNTSGKKRHTNTTFLVCPWAVRSTSQLKTATTAYSRVVSL